MMFGRAIRGTQAAPGSILLGNVDTDVGVNERALVIAGAEQHERRALVISESGQAFLGHDNFLQNDFWDVTGIAEFDFDLPGLRLERGGPRQGEIAVDDAGRLLLSFDRIPPNRAGWMIRETGEVLQNYAGPLVSVRGWRLVVRRGRDTQLIFVAKRTPHSKAA